MSDVIIGKKKKKKRGLDIREEPKSNYLNCRAKKLEYYQLWKFHRLTFHAVL